MEGYLSSLGIDYVTFIGVNLVLSIIAISLERKNPTAALAWLFFMALFPGIGFFFFLLLSQNISKRKIFKYTAEESEIYTTFLKEQEKSFEIGTYKFKDDRISNYRDMILFHNKLSEAFYSQNNVITLFTNGEDKFNDLMNEINNAKHHIHILYYIIKNDTLGNELFDLLAKKASEGVKVRILIDHVGGRTLRKKQIRKLKAAGCDVSFFFPSTLKYINFKANYRNHRKIVVIDGLTAYVGGYNVGDEYLGRKKRFGFWRDNHLKIVGDAVISLQLRFLLDWRNASKEKLFMNTEYIRESHANGKAGVQIVSSGPDSINEQIKTGYLKIINKATKYIYIQTPYFIPDESISEALKIAAVSGIDVRIMIPNKPDHLFVYWATYSHIGELLPYGVKVYTYEKGFLHAKTIVADDIISSVGTCNFDIRSFKLNFEVNAFIYDESTSKNIKNAFINDLKDCNEITLEKYIKRPFIIKVKESISRLFSPIL